MVTAASGAGRAGAARRPREGAAGCARHLACLPPRDKVTFCSGSRPHLQPRWHLAAGGEPLAKAAVERDARWGGMLAAVGVKGAGLRNSPTVPLTICKGHRGLLGARPDLLPASPACRSSTGAALRAPSPLLLGTLAGGGDGSFTLRFERAAREESCCLPPLLCPCCTFQLQCSDSRRCLSLPWHSEGTTSAREARPAPPCPVCGQRQAREPPSGEGAAFKVASRSLLLFYYEE